MSKSPLLGRIFAQFDSLVLQMGRWRRETLEDYCPLAGVADDITLFAEDGSLVSVLRIDGSAQLMGAAEKKQQLSQLSELFATLLRDQSTVLQIVYQRDRRHVHAELGRLTAPMRRKAAKLGLAVDPLLDERSGAIAEHLTGTELYIAVYTYSGTLVSPQMRKEFNREQARKADPDLPMGDPQAMRIYREPEVVLQRHRATLRTLLSALKRQHIAAALLSKHDIVKVSRMMLFPDDTAPDWKPRLPGDPLHPHLGETHRNDSEQLEAWAYPSIGRQIANAGAITRQGPLEQITKIADRYVSTYHLDLLPAKPKPFADLLDNIGEIEVPLRASLTFFGGADYYAGKVNMRRGMAYLAAITWPANKRIAAAGETLNDLVEAGTPCVGMSLMFSTWDKDPKRATDYGRRLGSALDAWGEAQHVPEIGDPTLAFTATLPGWTSNLRKVHICPVDYMLSSLPLEMIASPWREGTLFWRNQQGGIFPYQPLSSQQQTSNVVAFAPPGGGKSALISSMLLSAILDPTLEGLPKVALIDIGNSSLGAINLLRALARDPSQFVHLEFELTERYGINVMDTRLACMYPTTMEMGFLTNFLTLVFTPIGANEPLQNAGELASILIGEAYKMATERPALYDPALDGQIRDWLSQDRNFVPPKNMTWWQVVKYAISRKNYDIAARAQRFAVPTLRQLPSILTQSRTIQDLYSDQKAKDMLIECRRLLTAFIDKYPSLCKPSTFTLQETSVCVIDLNKVTQDSGPEGIRKTTIAYMVSRYLLGKDFLINRDVMAEMPPDAQQYYQSKLASLELVKKYLIYDEFHRTKGAASIRRQVVDDMRNGRKFNLLVMLASQSFEDFDDEMIKQATTRFVLRVDSRDEADALATKYSWSDTIRQALIRDVRGVTDSGSVMLVDFSGLKGMEGSCTQVVNNYMGRTELASYATTREDAALRAALQDHRIPFWDAVQLIGRLFPKGVKKELEAVMRADQESLDESEIAGALGPLIQRCLDVYRQEKAR